MNRRAGILIVVAAGILWGLGELFLGDLFYRYHIPFRSSVLTAIGISLLIVARMSFDRPGTSLAAGVVAAGIRSLAPGAYLCHAAAISLLGCAFDGSWTVLGAGERRSIPRTWLAAAVGVYLGQAGFGLAGAYAFRFGRWTAGGLSGVAGYALRSGTMSAVILLILVPLSVLASRRLVRAYQDRAGAPESSGR
jgi:hypothetical protein